MFNLWQFIAIHCNLLQFIAIFGNLLELIAINFPPELITTELQLITTELQFISIYCNVLQFIVFKLQLVLHLNCN